MDLRDEEWINQTFGALRPGVIFGHRSGTTGADCWFLSCLVSYHGGVKVAFHDGSIRKGVLRSLCNSSRCFIHCCTIVTTTIYWQEFLDILYHHSKHSPRFLQPRLSISLAIEPLSTVTTKYAILIAAPYRTHNPQRCPTISCQIRP